MLSRWRTERPLAPLGTNRAVQSGGFRRSADGLHIFIEGSLVFLTAMFAGADISPPPTLCSGSVGPFPMFRSCSANEYYFARAIEAELRPKGPLQEVLCCGERMGRAFGLG